MPVPGEPDSSMVAAVGWERLAGVGTWWGENLRGVLSSPVRLEHAGKVAYSPHTYGPSVYEQVQFDAVDFPRNMDAIWDAQFGFVAKQAPQLHMTTPWLSHLPSLRVGARALV